MVDKGGNKIPGGLRALAARFYFRSRRHGGKRKYHAIVVLSERRAYSARQHVYATVDPLTRGQRVHVAAQHIDITP